MALALIGFIILCNCWPQRMATGRARLIRHFYWSKTMNSAPLVADSCRSVVYRPQHGIRWGVKTPHRRPSCERYSLICVSLPPGALCWKVLNWPLSHKAPLVADPCRSMYIAHKMASDGVKNTPRPPFCERYTMVCMGLSLEALYWKVVNW